MNILVAYDGSAGARSALGAAVTIAEAANAHLLIAHVLSSRVVASSVFAQPAHTALAAEVDRAKAHVREQLAEHASLHIRALIEQAEAHEGVASALKRLADTHDAEFICVGSTRAGSIEGALLGSVAAELIRSARQPVIVAPPSLASDREPQIAWPREWSEDEV